MGSLRPTLHYETPVPASGSRVTIDENTIGLAVLFAGSVWMFSGCDDPVGSDEGGEI